MNKTEKIISLLLGAVLAWYIFNEMGRAKEAARSGGERSDLLVASPVAGSVGQSGEDAASPAAGSVRQSGEDAASPAAGRVGQNGEAAENLAGEATSSSLQEKKLPTIPERLTALENDEVKLELSTWGAVIKKVTLKKYAKGAGAVSEENPAVELDFTESPLGAGEQIEAFEIAAQDAQSVTFKRGAATRKITLCGDYRIAVEDDGIAGAVSLGAMGMGASKNDLLSVDSWALAARKGKPGVVHHGDDDSPLKPYLVGGLSGGCSGSKSAAGMPEKVTVEYPGAQTWVAVKNRFFVAALAECSAANTGFSATVTREMTAADYRPKSVAVMVQFADAPSRKMTFYVGPKKQSLLWDLGMKDVMEFGMWRWLCYPLVWVLNLFNGWIPNFGVAIILLTILVRVLFWPLTHKSTVGMKKMQEIQPLMKEIQAKYKDNPQRLQQETWQLYRDKKVNPMSSCLPMLIQIPVFIALFNVLRSAVELRYAPFLWIGDLSEPEALFANWFPFGGLNILPVLMALTTALQSAFTPSTGDKSQQRMMMVFMPMMMLVMFYSFPSALSLYWFLSNLLSIAQMWLIRRQTAAKREVLVPEVIDPPQTRQMKRHG